MPRSPQRPRRRPIHSRRLAQRDRLITAEFLALVSSIARQIQRRLPPCFDLDDLVGAGMLGLIDAATRYEPARRIPFGVYARIRIRGEIKETVRRRRWLDQTGARLPELAVDTALDESILEAELGGGIEEALRSLPKREALVIRRHYLEGDTIRSIAQSLNLSPGRASQLHLSALSRLRSDTRLSRLAA